MSEINVEFMTKVPVDPIVLAELRGTLAALQQAARWDAGCYINELVSECVALAYKLDK